MWTFVAFVVVSAGLTASIYAGTKIALLALVLGTLLPRVGNVWFLRTLHGPDAFDLIPFAICLVDSFVVSFLTLGMVSFSEE